MGTVSYGKIINPANAATSTRILVLPVVVWAMATHRVVLALVLLIYSGIVDLVDGSIARYFKCAGPFGEMLDAISDAGLFLVTLVTAAATGYVDVLPVAVFLGVGVLNALGRVIHIRRVGRVTNFRSYMSEAVGGATFFVLVGVLLDFYAETIIWWMALFTIVVVLHDYVRILTMKPGEEVPHV
ncbi:CDP-alcohol phosphatidyltransferase family protein [Myxococcota bacterium]|nr:CDP-alcohol phosphatidyltransferase family protein [Myxococcota bacterium]